MVHGSPEGSAPSSSEASRFIPTRRCPACESGMEAPGIRHNKECKKRFAEFEEESRKERRVEAEDEHPLTVDARHQMPVPSPRTN